MDIVIVLYDGLTPLDAIGPYEVLSRVPDARVRMAGLTPGLKQSGGRSPVGLFAEYALEDFPQPEVVLVPGGPGARSMLRTAELTDWIRAASSHAAYTTSVGTGSLLLAKAGVLDGLEAACHWSAHDLLREISNAIPSHERLVERGSVITAAGASAGIDLALRVAQSLTDDDTAVAIQIMVDYVPRSVFGTTDIFTASARVKARMEEITAHVRSDPDHRAEESGVWMA